MANRLVELISRIIKPKEKREQFAITETESTFYVGTSQYGDSDRDRLDYSRDDVLSECFEAWRDSPLARRIVELTSQYVIGKGLDISIDDEYTKEFINKFWDHRQNRMQTRVIELCDELTRSGNLFIILNTDQDGMSYIRTLPSTDIKEIIANEYDIEQPIKISTKRNDELEIKIYDHYDQKNDEISESGKYKTVIIQYAINRPAGGQWGEPDLAPLLPWLKRYTAWLEDRVRLNRFRNAFIYKVSADFVSEEARKIRQTQLAANPPTSGSILVTDNSEQWEVISPKLSSSDAGQDGMAIKKIIAAGVGLPLHFLAEPEGTNRTTAESAGGPTFRRFEQRQNFFCWIIQDLISIVVERKSKIDNKINLEKKIEVKGSDISARDNVSHSISGVNILNMAERLFNMGIISQRELLRMTYTFAGEQGDIDKIIEEGTGIDIREEKEPIKPATTDYVDTGTGTPKKKIMND